MRKIKYLIQLSIECQCTRLIGNNQCSKIHFRTLPVSPPLRGGKWRFDRWIGPESPSLKITRCPVHGLLILPACRGWRESAGGIASLTCDWSDSGLAVTNRKRSPAPRSCFQLWDNVPPANRCIIVSIVFADCSIVTELREKKALCRDLCGLCSLILFLEGNFLSKRNFLHLFFLNK